MTVVIGDPAFDDGKLNLFEIFKGWMQNKTEVEFDIETNVSDWWCDKKVDTVQFGNKDDQFVLRWKYLSAEQKDYVKSILENPHLTKIIHNALFECTVMLFHGIRVQNVYDTMLAEMVLQGGEHNVGYGLDDMCYRYLGIQLDKSQQKEFGEDKPLTPEKVTYAAQDVKYLGSIKEGICKAAVKLGYDTFDRVVELENSCVPAFAEMTFNGMELDKDWWLKLAAEAEPLVAAAQEKLNNWLKEEPFNSKAKELGYLSDEDRVQINWGSPKQKLKIFSTIYPELPGTSKQILKKWQSDRLKNQQSVPAWLPSYLDGYYTELQTELVSDHREWLIEENLLLPAGVPMINWNSQAQVLPLFQIVEKIDDLSAESLGHTSHPIIIDYQEFKDTAKLISSFGEKYLQDFIEPDGKVRTSFKQVLTTGRTASSSPNLQQLPKNERVGTKYKNAFIPPKGFKFVSSDFVSEELVVIAHISQEHVWIEALKKNQDLHSRVAEAVFKDKWKINAEDGCAFYKTDANGNLQMKKCSCTKHKYMRDAIKIVNFMLAYGGSHFKLASFLRISIPEAKAIIDDYFKALPKLKRTLDFLGKFGIEKGYTQTIFPYYRKRWFPNWKFYIRNIDAHLAGIKFHGGLGEIERASKNMPIQGSCGDILKLSLIKLYQYIYDNNLFDKVKLLMEVHDAIDTVVEKSFAEEWAKIQNQIMEDAAFQIIHSGLLKVDTSITDRWS